MKWVKLIKPSKTILTQITKIDVIPNENRLKRNMTKHGNKKELLLVDDRFLHTIVGFKDDLRKVKIQKEVTQVKNQLTFLE